MKNGNINVLGAIGNTPLVQLTNLNGKAGVKIFAKLEGNNPGGSIKDRPAFYMITMAEKSGELTKEKTIIEPTSGNTGIAVAMIGAAKGYKVKLFMPECVSVERQLILQAFGAEVVLTPAKEDASGTTGTLMGTGKYLKEKIDGIKIVAVEPTLGHTIQGLKNMQESVVPGIYNPEIYDEKLIVEDGDAFETARLLAVREGLFTGMSSGAAGAGALEAAKNVKKGNIVVILPDRGDRYLSTTLFRSICAKCPP